jgi:predicted nucleic acid-binding protein
VTLVVDASFVTAALQSTDSSLGDWAVETCRGHDLFAPHLLPVEVASALRRAELAGALSPGVAALAHRDLVALGIRLAPYEPLADRIWELRHVVTPYDAWYVALAEALDATLVTLDLRLARANGPTCAFLTPPV